MAFHDHLFQEMALQQLADQQLTQNTSVLRGLPEQLVQPSPDAAGKQPTWLNSAILRKQGQGHHQYEDGVFLHLQTSNSDSSASNQWITGRSIHGEGAEELPGIIVAASETAINCDVKDPSQPCEKAGYGTVDESNHWQRAKCKSDILAHPLYEQLLSAHVQCLRIATPVDQLTRIDRQLAQSQQVVTKYSVLGQGSQLLDDKDLDQFMTHYVLLLSSFKEQLQQHVRVHAMEAVMACWELEQSLQSFTGVAPGEGTGATMSDDDEELEDNEANLFDGNLDDVENTGFGPLVPTESERSLMERVRQELKHDLKQGYKDKIVDIREEILRKRRAGKLPCDTTSQLKSWWQSHSKWPYPTEEDKTRLVQETGLQLKQINNWFINQRKRNWNTNPTSSTTTKSKRKRDSKTGET
ncbi:homeobox protein knotted-1-like LET12 [Impatiens glandulifera]|uniref:homeobox protein knotted-1-like LET12 n=1 Tax=Impatiens glandulifera TaxID=253017 RepID=UPI001FB07C8D|nr:homeobox protein knotted-1-like LET12 [Impatiens glandulifera]